MLSSKEIREGFLGYFEQHGHQRVNSSPLIPGDDPTLLFTNAGMNQFKDIFTGARPAPYPRATTSQKCVRAGGKHNDLENVGFTARHHTFFEMLGNFSFGDYFKRDACRYGWDFVTNFLKLPPQRLWITVFRDDDEAFHIWRDEVGVAENRIVRMGEKDNFWAMGDTGPCGPCSEVHYDQGDGPGGIWKDADIHGDTDRFLEIWNLVFMQFERFSDGSMKPLPKPSIDTGAGLERMTALCQGVYSNYDTDIFLPLIHRMADIAGVKYGADHAADVSLRVVADHARAAAFLIGDHVFPSNDGRGYVLRRIMRRAIRHGRRLGVERLFFPEVCDAVIAHMADIYPELTANRDTILSWVEMEERSFRQTLDRGLKTLSQEMDRLRNAGQSVIPGGFAFRLYDQDGFPLDLTGSIAAEQGFSMDQAGFDTEMENQRQRGRASWKEDDPRLNERYAELYQRHGATAFTGYDVTRDQGTILALVDVASDGEDGVAYKSVTLARAGQSVLVVTDRTCFYGESGGQVGDTGEITTADGAVAVVRDTRKPNMDFFVHVAEVQQGTLCVGATATLAVDETRRDRIRANHSVTHLLHYALRSVLGAHVKQAGSLVTPERMRFDINHFKAISPDELARAEAIANGFIRENHPIATDVLPIEEARARGALMFFGEKYGETVRMLTMGPSKELCGGTHARRTGDIGLVRIVSEGAIAAGVRRIEAVTGAEAVAHTQREHAWLQDAAGELHCPPEQVGDRVRRFYEDIKDRERRIKDLEQAMARQAAGNLEDRAKACGGFMVLAAGLSAMDGKTLREFSFEQRDKLGPRSVVVLAAPTEDGKAGVVVTLGPEAVAAGLHAGKLMQALSPLVGGKGGGRPENAQGGGSDPSGIDALLAAVWNLIPGA